MSAPAAAPATGDSPAASAAPAARGWSEATWAFLMLRAFLGLRSLVAGVDKFENSGVYSLDAYHRNMGALAENVTGNSFLPLWSTKLFAFSLGYMLTGLGLAVLLGLRSRLSLGLLGFLFVALSFGLMAADENEGVAWLGVQVAMVAGALLLVRHERLALWPSVR